MLDEVREMQRLIEASGMTRQEIAVLLGVSYSTVKAWLKPSHKNQPLPRHIRALEALLKQLGKL